MYVLILAYVNHFKGGDIVKFISEARKALEQLSDKEGNISDL